MASETAPEDGIFAFPSYQYCTEGEVAPWEGEDSPTLMYETTALLDDGHGHSAPATATAPVAAAGGGHAAHVDGGHSADTAGAPFPISP